jgi:TRAP-type C4-dicarboxylate transport system permease small subunit
MKKVLKWLDEHFEESMIVALLTVMTFSIFYQVIMRYIFSNAPSWTEELTRYAFIWCAYFGVSLGIKKDAHISVMAVINLLPKKGQKVMHIVANLIFLAFAVIILVLGYQTMVTVASLGRRSPALEIPMYLVYAALPVGFICIVVRLIQAIYKQVRNFKQEEEEQKEDYSI